jgi:rhamnosyltransferase
MSAGERRADYTNKNRDMHKILVLLSTYNGEHYILEQIQSILDQENVDLKIVVRDDGSNDSTVNILKGINDARLEIHAEQNIGCIHSFTWLVNYASEHYLDYDFYAFADQDDYWMKEKLSKGIESINRRCNEKPMLYFCNMQLVDANLNIVKNIRNHDIDIRKGNAWLGGRAAGCTMVFNRRLLDMYADNNPKFCYHDYWAFLIALYFGEIIYDNKPYIKYRQHEYNVLGAHGQLSHKVRNKQRIDYWFKDNKSGIQRKCAKDFLSQFNNLLSEDNKRIIKTYIGYHKSISCWIRFVTSKEFGSNEPERKSLRGQTLFIIRSLFGKY